MPDWSRFEEKYRDVELQLLNAETVEDEDECLFLMQEVSADLAEAKEALSLMRAKALSRREWADPHIYSRAARLVDDLKVVRNAVQERRGVLRDRNKLLKSQRFEQAFIQEARMRLDAETFKAIHSAARLSAGLVV